MTGQPGSTCQHIAKTLLVLQLPGRQRLIFFVEGENPTPVLLDYAPKPDSRIYSIFSAVRWYCLNRPAKAIEAAVISFVLFDFVYVLTIIKPDAPIVGEYGAMVRLNSVLFLAFMISAGIMFLRL